MGRQGDEWPNLNDKATEGGKTGGDSGKVDVAGEFQELGQRLAATARVLWQSEQRQDLQREVADGLQRLRDQLSGAAETMRANPQVQSLKGQIGQKVETGRASDIADDVRSGLTTGLQALNEQLRRFTERLEQRDAPAEAATTEATPAEAEAAEAAPAQTATAADVAAVAGIVAAEPRASDSAATPKSGLPAGPEGPATGAPR